MTLPHLVFFRRCVFAGVLFLAGLLQADEAQDLFGRGEKCYQTSNWTGADTSWKACPCAVSQAWR